MNTRNKAGKIYIIYLFGFNIIIPLTRLGIELPDIAKKSLDIHFKAHSDYRNFY